MKNSLKDKLNNFIRERGEVSYGEICAFTSELGYRIPTMERRLRSSESPDIEAVMGRSQRHTAYIKGYRIKGIIPRKKVEWFEEGGVMVQKITTQ